MAAEWTDERRAEVVRLKAKGLTYQAIADRLRVSRSAVAGVIHRVEQASRVREYRQHYKRETATGRLRGEPCGWGYEVAASKTPFAADCTCPDFAWDDEHCAAVMAEGGFVSLDDVKRAA